MHLHSFIPRPAAITQVNYGEAKRFGYALDHRETILTQAETMSVLRLLNR